MKPEPPTTSTLLCFMRELTVCSSSIVGGSTPPGGRIAPSRVLSGTGFWLSTAL